MTLDPTALASTAAIIAVIVYLHVRSNRAPKSEMPDLRDMNSFAKESEAPKVTEPYNPPPERIKLRKRHAETDPNVISEIKPAALDILNAKEGTVAHKDVSRLTGVETYEYYNETLRPGWTLRFTRPHFKSETYHSWTAYSPRGIPCHFPPGLGSADLDEAAFEYGERTKIPTAPPASVTAARDAANASLIADARR